MARQKMPGDWVFLFDDSDLDPAQKEIFSGMANHVADCFFYICAASETHPDDLLRLQEIAKEIEARLVEYSPPVTTEDRIRSDFFIPVEAAFLFSVYVLTTLAKNVPAAIRAYTMSVSSLAVFKTQLIWAKSGSSSDPGSKKTLIDPSEIGKVGAKSRWRARDAVRDFALQKFNEREWQSRADGIRRIAKDVYEKADEVGFPYKTSNFERTISDWIRVSNTSGS